MPALRPIIAALCLAACAALPAAAATTFPTAKITVKKENATKADNLTILLTGLSATALINRNAGLDDPKLLFDLFVFGRRAGTSASLYWATGKDSTKEVSRGDTVTVGVTIQGMFSTAKLKVSGAQWTKQEDGKSTVVEEIPLSKVTFTLSFLPDDTGACPPFAPDCSYTVPAIPLPAGLWLLISGLGALATAGALRRPQRGA